MIMALNVDRLLEELTFVTVHPDKHEQSLWAEAATPLTDPDDRKSAPRPSACGSFGCLAGNTAIHEEGVELDWYQSHVEKRDGRRMMVWQADNVLNEFVTRKDWFDGTEYQEAKSIDRKAAEILGLTPFQADKFFDGDNTLDRLWALAEQITLGEISGSKEENWSRESYGHALSLAKAERDRVAREALPVAAED